MELIEDHCDNCGKECSVVMFSKCGLGFSWLCKDCLERALRLINGKDDE